MESRLTQRVALFAKNAQAIKKEFTWQNTILKRLAALLYAAEDRAIDLPTMRECHGLVKGSTGLFSSFRGNSALIVAALLSLRRDSAALLEDTLKVYEAMKRARFGASDYLAVAACQIACGVPRERQEEAIGRARAFYDGMKGQHRFLTGRGGYLFAAMLGMSDIGVADGVQRIERLFRTLRPEFHSGAGVQALAQVLTLGGAGEGAEARVLALRDALRRRGLRLDREYTLSSLGVLALLPPDSGDIAAQVAEAAEALRGQKGFGFWSSVTKQEWLLLSAALVSLNSLDRAGRGVWGTALSTSVINIVIAQQATLAAATAASASAAASSSSG